MVDISFWYRWYKFAIRIENMREKEDLPEVPAAGKAVLQQQLVLAEAIEKWILSVKENFPMDENA